MQIFCLLRCRVSFLYLPPLVFGCSSLHPASSPLSLAPFTSTKNKRSSTTHISTCIPNFHNHNLTQATSSNSMSNDNYTPSPSPSPPPPGGRTAEEWDKAKQLAFKLAFDNEDADSIAETRLRQHTRRIVAKPSTMFETSYTDPPWEFNEFLRIIPRPKDRAMYTNNDTVGAYNHAMLRQIRVGEIKNLIIHVLNFDFSLAVCEIFSLLEPQARALYHSRNTGTDRVKIWLTVTPEFARNWYPSLLQKWLDWRHEERVAGRGFWVQYAASRGNEELSLHELENFRQFLHFVDPDGDMPGDMGGIMAAMKVWFRGEYVRRGF